MNTYLKASGLALGLVLLHLHLFAQVGEVKKKSRENQSQKESRNAESGSSGGGEGGDFFISIFAEMFTGLGHAHANMLSRKTEEPWLVSLETNLPFGYYFPEETFLFLPSIRGNWGLFSTQLRYNLIQDKTGFFRTLDWQVIQLNIVARPKVNFWMGTGISYEFDSESTFHDNLAGLALHLKDRTIHPSVEFRFSRDYETATTPRLEVHPKVDFLVSQTRLFDFNLSVGMVFQQYYEEVNFFFLQTGLSIILK